MKQKPNLPFWSLWNLSFGFFGVQIAYKCQHLTHLCHTGCRPPQSELFLDTASTDGHSGTTDCGNVK